MASAKRRQEEQAAELVADDDDDDDDDLDADNCSCKLDTTAANLMTAGDSNVSAPCANQLFAARHASLPPAAAAGMFCRHSSNIFGSFTVVQ